MASFAITLSRTSRYSRILALCSLLVLLSLTQATAGTMYSGVFGTWGIAKDQMFTAAKDNGFKIVVSSDVAKAQSMGLQCLYPINVTKDIASDTAKWSVFLRDTKNLVSSYKNNPAVFGWYVADEPDWKEILPQRFKELNSAIKEVDKNKPVVGIFTMPEKWYKYLAYFDIVAIDPYLLNTHNGNETDKVKSWIDGVSRDLKKYKLKKPVWVVLGAFEQLPKSGAKAWFRKPTSQEFNTMLQACIDSKVAGVLIFSLSIDETSSTHGWNIVQDDPNLWEAVRKTTSKLP